MKQLCVLLFMVLFTAAAFAQNKGSQSPLAGYAKEWNNPKYAACNTGANSNYLPAPEKEILYILNLARMHPQLFAKTVLPHAHEVCFHIDTADEEYYKTLVTQMMEMKPMPALAPDSLCYVSAQCHVVSSGPMGVVTHERQTDECSEKARYGGECCSYGTSGPLGIVLMLLVDRNQGLLGHRKICFGKFERMSPAVGSHAKFGTMAVLDFSGHTN